MLRLALLLTLGLQYIASAQPTEASLTADLINRLYKSDSSNFILDLTLIPSRVTGRIMRSNDSIYKEVKTSKLKGFLANTYGDWNSTDEIADEKWPSRRFIYAINQGTRWIITYEHGGIGNHYHIIYFDERDYKSLTASATLFNSGKIHDLVWDKKTEEIKRRPFATIVNQNDFHLLNGTLIKSYDIF